MKTPKLLAFVLTILFYTKILSSCTKFRDVSSVEGLRNLIRSTSWTFKGFGETITYEFDSDSTFKRSLLQEYNSYIVETGTYKILSARYSRSTENFLYIELQSRQTTVTSGRVFPSEKRHYLIPDSTVRLFDPTEESALWTYNDNETSFKALTEDGKYNNIKIERGKDINGYKLTNHQILLYPLVLDFFPSN